MKTRRPASLLSAAAISLFFLGCEGSDSGGGSGTWNEPPKPTTTTRPAPKPTTTTRPAATQAASSAEGKKPASSSSSANSSSSSSSSAPAPAPAPSGGAVGADAVSYGSLRWTFGGNPNGAGARNGGVVISGARFSRDGISFNYDRNLSAWGYSDGALGGIACLFVQKTNGQWVGGKFDWISSSRRSRSFENVFSGYGGWSLADVPNPCAAAFVIVSPDGNRRSNVIAGTWSR